ncbi:hypothetical protein G7072_01035 [Nocardioides sp. HDW12B]|uniref:hypothetical protein n=1 Tax=Nocardioides sp. HDW12B TaxID=2714939 RepID=UPI00140C1E2D|nr:hypothetical protein [Nocardioides sp. HDW12B]QIK65109.1 hypothetical protein G7072_01035 [Nocardioides sp. HDW12B]
MTSSRPPGAPARRPVRGRRRPPARVFWVRRVVALALVGALVWAFVGLVGMLDLSADGETETPQATTAGATPSATPTVDPDAAAAAAERRAAARALRIVERAEKRDELVEPTGPCADGEVVVTPQVPDAHAGADITVELELTTEESAACTFEVDPDDVFVTIKDDTSTIWSSQHCPATMPTATTVPRRTTPDTVSFTWNGKESMTGCAVDTDWVFPGVYQITAVARGSVTPVETLFALGKPEQTEPAEPEETDEDSESTEDAESSEDAAAREDEARDGSTSDEQTAEPETEEEAAERREARREALREARRQQREDQREDQRAERDAG